MPRKTYTDHLADAINIAEGPFMAALLDAYEANEWADVDYTIECVMAEVKGLVEYLRDPSNAAFDSLGFTG